MEAARCQRRRPEVSGVGFVAVAAPKGTGHMSLRCEAVRPPRRVGSVGVGAVRGGVRGVGVWAAPTPTTGTPAAGGCTGCGTAFFWGGFLAAAIAGRRKVEDVFVY
jgi:hypothetical protein